MYLDHFGLNEAPFRITPHTDFFFNGANRGPTLEALLYAITHDEGIVKVTGEVGSGKTMLCRVLMERLPENVQTILLANPALSRDEIIFAIAEELGIRQQSEHLSVLLLKLQEHLIKLYGENRRVALLIDEAQAMPQETLEQVRLLSNLESSRSKLLQIVLFGQPELNEHLSMPHMRQLKERITHSFRLEPMRHSDIEAYLDFRMRAAGYCGPSLFTPEAVRRIVRASKGLTRRVNILADKSLLSAFADNEHGITAKHVNRAIRDAAFYRPGISTTKFGLVAGGVAAGLVLSLGLHYALSSAPPPVPSLSTAPAQAAAAISPPPQPAAVREIEPAQTALPGAAIPPAASALTQQAHPVGERPAQTPTSAAVPGPATIASSAANPIAPTTLAAGAQTKVVEHPAAGQPDARSGPQPGADNFMPPAPQAGRLTRARFTATQEWLKDAPGDQYSIQLLTVGKHDTRRIEELLARAAGRNLKLPNFHVYGVKINEIQHYRLAYGLYPSTGDAQRGINSLPPAYKRLGPFARSVERMRSQNRQ